MNDATLVFDDDCGFCTWWAEFFQARSGVEIVGFSELDEGLLDRLPPSYESCSHIVTEDAVYSCGGSLEEGLLRTTPGSYARPIVERLRGVGPYDWMRERGYRLVANNRVLGGKILSRTPPGRGARCDHDARETDADGR